MWNLHKICLGSPAEVKNTAARCWYQRTNFYCVTHSIWESVKIEPRTRKKMSKVKAVDTRFLTLSWETVGELALLDLLIYPLVNWGRSLRILPSGASVRSYYYYVKVPPFSLKDERGWNEENKSRQKASSCHSYIFCWYGGGIEDSDT